MKMRTPLILLLVLALEFSASAAPVKIIFDTDMAGDVDDVGALALLHALENRGEAEILACMISAPNEFVGPCIDSINTWFGRPEIPIGNLRGFQDGYPKATTTKGIDSKYTEAVAKACAHRLQRSSEAPDAVQLYRKILSAQPDGSVTIVSVGFLTNLKNLLDSEKDGASELTGEKLVAKKVKQWVCMGGKFPKGQFDNGEGEYNVTIDTVASVRAMNDWPTPVVFSGFEIGSRIFTGERAKELPENSPVRVAYKYYTGGKHRESWDQTAALYAVRGAGEYWTLSEPGFALMHARLHHGYNEWIPSQKHQHRYLIEKMPAREIAKVIEGLMLEAPKTK
jgi:purine nucleosidase